MTIIFQDRGKQYKVKVGDFIKLPKMSSVKKNDLVLLNEIIFYKNDKGESLIGSPTVENIVIKAKFYHDPESLLEICKKIEILILFHRQL